jgi:hypothetical protein
MDKMTTTYVGVGLVTCVVGLIGWTLLQHRSRARAKANEAQLLAFLARQSPGSPRQRPPRSVPDARRPKGDGRALAALEAQLGNAIFRADARERLIKDALPHTGGDRAAAIRKVLSDLHAENNRWS